MLFSSLTFLYFFLPIVLILYFVIHNRTWRNSVLLVSSLVFYSWGEPKYVFLMLASTLVAWLCGLGIDRFKEKRRISRAFLIASLVLLLGSLAVFKYLNFFVENLNRIDGVALKVRNIALPIGISFYTFQILSYLIDLYWEKVSVQKSYFRFTLYVCLFPQLIAGPIVRYETVEREISLRRESCEEAVGGMRRFILGLAKKVLIANNVAAVAEYIYSSSNAGSGAYWLAAVCYTLQIYFDFSGYSDMAIGLGRIAGPSQMIALSNQQLWCRSNPWKREKPAHMDRILSNHPAFSGSKPSASYFKRDFCTAYLHQKVPKFFELYRAKKYSRTILLTIRK